MALKLDILANTRQFQSEMKKSGESVDDISDALDALVTEAATAGDRSSESIQDIGDASTTAARDVDSSADKMERRFRELAQDAKKTDKAVEDIGDGGQRGFTRAGDAATEFKEEAVSNFSEIASSFDGSMASVGELAQGTLGGLASTSIPGIGVAAGLAAAGIGTITNAFEEVTAATEEAKDSAYTYGLTVAASSDFATTSARVDELTGSVESLKKIQDLATASGWEQKDVLNALATGDGLPALTKAFEDNSLSTNISMGRLSELDGILRGTAQGFDLATDGAQLHESAMYDLATRVGTATGKFDDLGRQIYNMPGGKEIAVDAKTQTATEALDEVADRVKNLPDGHGTVKYSVDDSAIRRYQPSTKYAQVQYEASTTRKRQRI